MDFNHDFDDDFDEDFDDDFDEDDNNKNNDQPVRMCGCCSLCGPWNHAPSQRGVLRKQMATEQKATEIMKNPQNNPLTLGE